MGCVHSSLASDSIRYDSLPNAATDTKWVPSRDGCSTSQRIYSENCVGEAAAICSSNCNSHTTMPMGAEDCGSYPLPSAASSCFLEGDSRATTAGRGTTGAASASRGSSRLESFLQLLANLAAHERDMPNHKYHPSTAASAYSASPLPDHPSSSARGMQRSGSAVVGTLPIRESALHRRGSAVAVATKVAVRPPASPGRRGGGSGRSTGSSMSGATSGWFSLISGMASLRSVSSTSPAGGGLPGGASRQSGLRDHPEAAAECAALLPSAALPTRLAAILDSRSGAFTRFSSERLSSVHNCHLFHRGCFDEEGNINKDNDGSAGGSLIRPGVTVLRDDEEGVDISFGRKIGIGGAATVYLADYNGEQVAVKHVSGERRAGLPRQQQQQQQEHQGLDSAAEVAEDFVGMLQLEATVMSLLTGHPNVLAAHRCLWSSSSSTSSSGGPAGAAALGPRDKRFECFIVMQYCAQGSLWHALRRGALHKSPEHSARDGRRRRAAAAAAAAAALSAGSKGPKQQEQQQRGIVPAGAAAATQTGGIMLWDSWASLETLMEVARAAAFMHESGVVHGDIKAGNVLLSDSGRDRRCFEAKLADFGFARFLTRQRLAVSGYATVTHQPPELLADGVLTPAADVFALGVLMWEVYTADTVYKDLEDCEVALVVTQARLRPTLPSGCPEGYRNLMDRCLADLPESRPGMVEVLLQLTALQRELCGSSGAAAPLLAVPGRAPEPASEPLAPPAWTRIETHNTAVAELELPAPPAQVRIATHDAAAPGAMAPADRLRNLRQRVASPSSPGGSICGVACEGSLMSPMPNREARRRRHSIYRNASCVGASTPPTTPGNDAGGWHSTWRGDASPRGGLGKLQVAAGRALAPPAALNSVQPQSPFAVPWESSAAAGAAAVSPFSPVAAPEDAGVALAGDPKSPQGLPTFPRTGSATLPPSCLRNSRSRAPSRRRISMTIFEVPPTLHNAPSRRVSRTMLDHSATPYDVAHSGGSTAAAAASSRIAGVSRARISRTLFDRSLTSSNVGSGGRHGGATANAIGRARSERSLTSLLLTYAAKGGFDAAADTAAGVIAGAWSPGNASLSSARSAVPMGVIKHCTRSTVVPDKTIPLLAADVPVAVAVAAAVAAGPVRQSSVVDIREVFWPVGRSASTDESYTAGCRAPRGALAASHIVQSGFGGAALATSPLPPPPPPPPLQGRRSGWNRVAPVDGLADAVNGPVAVGRTVVEASPRYMVPLRRK